MGNPTQLSGTFYDAFHGKAEAGDVHAVEPPQPELLRGECRRARGRGVREERAHRLGRRRQPAVRRACAWALPSAGEQVVVPLALVEAGKARWATTPDEGRLELGLDPARGGGDDAILVPRRGLRVGMACPIPVDASNTVTPPGHQVGLAVIRYVAQHRRGAEVPRVKVDAIGIGSSVVDFLWAHVQACKAEGKPVPFEVVAVVSSQAASEYIQVRPGASAKDEFENLRTQLGFGVTEFLHKGRRAAGRWQAQAELVAAKYAFTGGEAHHGGEGRDQEAATSQPGSRGRGVARDLRASRVERVGDEAPTHHDVPVWRRGRRYGLVRAPKGRSCHQNVSARGSATPTRSARHDRVHAPYAL